MGAFGRAGEAAAEVRGLHDDRGAHLEYFEGAADESGPETAEEGERCNARVFSGLL